MDKQLIHGLIKAYVGMIVIIVFQFTNILNWIILPFGFSYLYIILFYSFLYNKKIKKRHIQVIKPLVKICVKCKLRKVTDHHFLCNKCYSKKQKRIYFKSKHLNIKKQLKVYESD